MFGYYHYWVPLAEIKEMKEYQEGLYQSSTGLIPFVKALGDNIVAGEIGVAFGTNMIYMMDECPNISKFYAIDPWEEYQDWGPELVFGFMAGEMMNKVGDKFAENLKDYDKRDQVVVLKKTSEEACKEIPDNTFDYLFIDGNHSEVSVKQDCLNYYSKVKSGGIMSGHDYDATSVQNGVRSFMEEIGIPADKLQVVHAKTPPCWMIIKD